MFSLFISVKIVKTSSSVKIIAANLFFPMKLLAKKQSS